MESDNENPSGVFFTLFLRSFILLHELECVVGASVVRGGAKSDQRCARGFAVLQYTRKHGLVRERRVCVTSDYEPWDPAASLADPTLGRACHETRCEKRAMTTITIHGEKFTGNPRDWKDAKTEIVTGIANAGCTFVMDAGTTLFQLAGSGDHSYVGDDEIAKHFEEKEWPTQLLSIRSQITKTTLDTKCEEYQALSDQSSIDMYNNDVSKRFMK
jgi:hypothetical protein